MKNLKLGKWGIGLQKSMFEYDKDTYLKDKHKCVICLKRMYISDIDNLFLTKCNHIFHSNCINNLIRQTKFCPMCYILL